MQNTLINTLIDLGLSENESKVYFATLSLGSSTVLKISNTAGIKRTTVYSVIESLKQKGLISIELKGFKQYFVATSPEKLETILESKKEKLSKMMPEFTALYNLKGGESFIKYYEGIESIKSIYEGLLKDIRVHQDYLVISDHDMWYNIDPKYFENFLRRRAKLNINIRVLLQDSKFAKEHQKREKNYNEIVKLLPKDTSITTNLVATPQRVVIHQLIPPIMAIVIENKSVIKMHQEFFEIMWRSI